MYEYPQGWLSKLTEREGNAQSCTLEELDPKISKAEFSRRYWNTCCTSCRIYYRIKNFQKYVPTPILWYQAAHSIDDAKRFLCILKNGAAGY